MAADTTVLALPGGTLNSQQSQGLLASALGPPAAEVAAGAMLITVASVQQTLATWLATIQSITLPLSAANGGTGATSLGATSLSVSGGVLVARTAARMQIQWVSGAVAANGTVYFTYDPPYPGTINSLTYFAGTGSLTVAVQIAGTPVTGLGAVAVNSATPATTNASAANTFTAGQIISGVITGASGSPTPVMLSLAVTWGA